MIATTEACTTEGGARKILFCLLLPAAGCCCRLLLLWLLLWDCGAGGRKNSFCRAEFFCLAVPSCMRGERVSSLHLTGHSATDPVIDAHRRGRTGRCTAPLLRSPAQGADTITWLAGQEASPPTGCFWFDRAPQAEHVWPWTRRSEHQLDALVEHVFHATEPYLSHRSPP